MDRNLGPNKADLVNGIFLVYFFLLEYSSVVKTNFGAQNPHLKADESLQTTNHSTSMDVSTTHDQTAFVILPIISSFMPFFFFFSFLKDGLENNKKEKNS